MAGRLGPGTGFISVCLETRWLSQKLDVVCMSLDDPVGATKQPMTL